MSSQLTKRQLAGRLVVDDGTYTWQLDREPRATSRDGFTGCVVTVVHEEGERQLQLELANQYGSQNGTPYHRRPKIGATEIEAGIRAALDAGWKPLSRGKPFRFEIGGA